MEELQNNLTPSEESRPEMPVNKGFSSRAMSLRTLLTSGKMLAMIICLAVAIFLVPLGRQKQAEMGSIMVNDMLEQLEYTYGYNYDMNQFYDYLDTARSSSFMGSMFGSLPLILTAVGFLIIFLSVRNAMNDRISTTGFSMLKVMNIIGIVGYSLLALLVVLVSILMIVIGFASGEPSLGIVMLVLFGVFFLIFGAIIALMIIKNAGLDSSIESIKAAINDDTVVKKVSGFSVVMLYIIGVLNGLTLITALTTTNIFGMLGSAAAIGYYILLGINLNLAKEIINS
ncbi:MAG: hypothetical protein K6F63_01435 [Lachnospiraceae bacterium]|nr:hypothetical protein [Lachnospiraceae bacterium]